MMSAEARARRETPHLSETREKIGNARRTMMDGDEQAKAACSLVHSFIHSFI